MAKKIKTVIKLNLAAGEATPAPPLGPALGQHGLPIMDFVKAYNEATVDQKGNIVPVVITVYEDRSYSFATKLPPVSEMIKKELGLEKASGEAGRNQVGKLSSDQLRKIAEAKINDLNSKDLAGAIATVAGTARSMGVTIEKSKS